MLGIILSLLDIDILFCFYSLRSVRRRRMFRLYVTELVSHLSVPVERMLVIHSCGRILLEV